MSVDRVVLGGLDEGTWPPRTDHGRVSQPTHARPRRPRAARAAHRPDRARFRAGARHPRRGDHPRAEARRIAHGALALPAAAQGFCGRGGCGRACVAGGDAYRRLARECSTRRSPRRALARPRPEPDPALFPRSLSVTEIEILVRDPYSIFARHILKLDALDAIAVRARRRRSRHDHPRRARLLRASLSARSARARARGPARPRRARTFADIAEAFPELYAEWWPRFDAPGDAQFVLWEAERRPGISRRLRRVLRRACRSRLPTAASSPCAPAPTGSSIGATAASPSSISRPASRRGSGGLCGLLAAADARGHDADARARSKDCPPRRTRRTCSTCTPLAGEMPMTPREIKPTGEDETRPVAEIVEEHRAPLRGHDRALCQGRARLTCRGRFPKYARRFSDYDHLARVKEWSLASGEGTANEHRDLRHPAIHQGCAAPCRRSARFRLGVGQCGRRQDEGAHRPGRAAAARRLRARAHPLPDLHQGGGRQHGDPRVRTARPMGDAGRREPARRTDGARRATRRAARSSASPARCSPARSKRRAGSRSTPSTLSARGCCIWCRSRRTCRRASRCSTRTRAARCWPRKPPTCWRMRRAATFPSCMTRSAIVSVEAAGEKFDRCAQARRFAKSAFCAIQTGSPPG